MKVAIIGGGISGLSCGQLLLKKGYEVTIFEKESRPGGLIKCDNIEGNLFHTTGGHVFNTKRDDVRSLFWSFFDHDKQFTKAERNSSVFMADGKIIPYPIENHVFMLDKETGLNIVSDLVKMAQSTTVTVDNFEEFLKARFGETLYNLYFQPYNEKIWRRDLSKVPISWLEGKLPMPTVEEIIFNNIFHIAEKKFVHSSFFYPVKGGSQFIANTMAKGLDIRLNKKICRISKNRDNAILVNDEIFDKLIFCGNIKNLPHIISGILDISGFTEPIEKLEYHGTTSVFCEITPNPYSWVYLPSREHLSHRIICTGNFSPNNNKKNLTATVEFTDEISKDEILTNLEKIPLSPKYITHHFEKYTYPIQDSHTRNMISCLKHSLEKENIFLCGRFAEWEYANMDVCMGYAIDLVKKFK